MNTIGVLEQLDPSTKAPIFHIRKSEAEMRISTSQAVWVNPGQTIRKTPAWGRLTPDAIIQKQTAYHKSQWAVKQSGPQGPLVMQLIT